MRDEEYQDFLSALARKYLHPSALGEPAPTISRAQSLEREAERLAAVARLVTAVGDYPNDGAFRAALGQALQATEIGDVIRTMDDVGVLDALDEAPDVVFGQLRASALPIEEALFLQHAGVGDPESEIALIIHYAKAHLSTSGATPSELAWAAEGVLADAADRLQSMAAPTPPKQKRKLFNGIGKILAGAVTGAGNILLLTGTVVAPNPATAYGVIASSALAIGSVGQGIGDLRGE